MNKPIGTVCATRILLAFLALPVGVQAQFTYTTNHGAITITKYDCSSDVVTIPGKINGRPVISIGKNVFCHCHDIVFLSAEVETITNLTSVTIPASVTSIGWSAFAHCYALSAITVDAHNPVYSSVDGVLFDKSQTALILYPEGKSKKIYAIPTSVTNIGDRAFGNCKRLTSVTIPNSLTSIGINAFWNCANLTNITIGNSVASIGIRAFGDCTGLTDITIPKSVTNIQKEAFWNCKSLTGVYFQGNAPSVGETAFDGANKATVYYLPGTTGWGKAFSGRPTAVWTGEPSPQPPPLPPRRKQ